MTAHARLRVVASGPLVSFQDTGRPGHMRFGVPTSGPMDRVAHAAANASIGNDPAATAIEVSAVGVTLEVVAGAITVAVTGGGAEVDGRGATSWDAFAIDAGARITVRPGPTTSWAYLAVAGEVDVPRWLGRTATHSMSGFGGGVLRVGDEIVVHRARVDPHRHGGIPTPEPGPADGLIRVVVGPQERHFEEAAVEAFTTSPYVLTGAYDRMGVRLDGPRLGLAGALSIPSEPIVRGSVQVTGDGVPTVLLADHQTTGGYPKIATVVSVDLDRFARRRAGDTVMFRPVDSSEAVEIARATARATAGYLARLAGEGRTLAHRLRRENLIGDAGPASECD